MKGDVRGLLFLLCISGLDGLFCSWWERNCALQHKNACLFLHVFALFSYGLIPFV